LLAEEEDDLRDAIALVLRRQGYEVVPVGDGLEAADQVARDLPDLAVIGMLLPGLSGFRVAEQLKLHSDGRVPVIMISASPSAAHRDYALAAGVDAFLPVPFPLHALTNLARTLCPTGSGSWTIPWAVATRP
jgi:DNA-binding response OmpR family regulator